MRPEVAATPRWDLLASLFEAGAGLPLEERRAFIERSCGGDDELGSDLARLLSSAEEGPRFVSGLADALRELSWDAALDEGPQPPSVVGPYRVLDEIGRGGMGVVYVARDERLGRLVALKFLPAYLSADRRARERLLREARAASASDHPAIATLYEIGETEDGRTYLVMAYYEGETLRGRLAAGALPPEQAAEIAIQVADGLSAAHGRGVIHRDIKPANILLGEDGRVRILDFGVAKLSGAEVSAEGVRIGTLGYMSPEQVQAEPVDARSDLWSLGVVLYEMLAGRRPFAGEADGAVLHAILEGEPAPLPPDGSPELSEIVARLLRRDPAERYPDAAALREDLERWRVGLPLSAPPPRARLTRRFRLSIRVAALAVPVAGVLLLARVSGRDPPPVLAVGEIRGVGPDSAAAASLGGLLSSGLGHVPDLPLLGHSRLYGLRTELSRVEGEPVSAEVAARRAGAREILEGELSRSTDGRLRLHLRRTDLRTGSLRESRTVAGPDVPALVRRAVAGVASDLGLKLPFPSDELPLQSQVAQRLYEEGLKAWYEGGFSAADRLFQAALAEDTSFAMAAYYLVRSQRALSRIPGTDPLVRRAIRLADRAPPADRLLLRTVWAMWTGLVAPPAPEALAESLAVLRPLEPDGHYFLGALRSYRGDFLGALPHLRRAIELDSLGLRGGSPRCVACDAFHAMIAAYGRADSVAAAERVAREWTRLKPNSGRPWFALARGLADRGRAAEALQTWQRALPFQEGHAFSAIFPAYVALRAGDWEEADRRLRDGIAYGTTDVRRESLWWLALSLREQGRLEAARAASRRERMERVAAETPGPYPPYSALLEGQILTELGRPRPAIALFDSIATAFTRREEPRIRPVWPLAQKATALAVAGDTAALWPLADTVRELGSVRTYGRDQRLHHYVRGLALARRGDAHAAAAELRKGVYSLRVGYTRVNLELSRALLAAGEPLEAIRVLDAALRGNIDASGTYLSRTEMHEELGRAWEAAGRPDSAAAHHRWVAKAWASADPILQPRRERAAARLRALQGEPAER